MPAASPQHEAAAAGGGFTVLRSITGRVATKRFFLGPRGRIGKHGYGRERLFSLACRAANGIHEFATLLRRLERDPRAFIVRASPLPGVNLRRARRLLHPDPRTGDRPTFEPAARAWAMLDLDGVACPAGLDPRVPGDAAELIEYLIGLLPPEFHDASCFWQWSASQSVPERLDCEPSDRLRAHLFFWLDCPVPDRELRRWARTLKRDGLAIDPTVFAPVQAHYTAAPVFDGLRDPLPLRSGFRNGLVDAVPLVLPPAEQTLGTADGHGRGRAGNGAGVDVHLERIGPEGYQDPIMATVAAYIARHGSQADDEHLKDVIRERIAQAEPQYPRSTADIDRYRSDGYLDGKIAWTRARQQEREQAAVAAAEHTSLQAYFGADAADRDGMLAAQAEAIRSWVERNYAIAKARREIERRREAAHAEAGLAGDAPATADPDAEVSRRKAAISWRVRREVLAEIGLDNLPKDGERLLITGAQGTGKSRTVAEAIAGMTDDITMRWLVPTLDKAEEQAEEYRRLSVPGCLLVTVVRGRSAPDPDNSGQAMCPRHAVVNRAAAMAVDVQEAICRHCQLRQQCGYQRQRSDLQGRESGLFLAASDYFWLPCPAPQPDLLVVDESIIGKASDTIRLEPYRLTEDDTWASWDLALALRNRRTAAEVRAAIVEHSGRELTFLRGRGVSTDDLKVAVQHLGSREELRPDVHGQMSDAAIAAILDAVEVRELRKVLILFRQVRRELEQPRARLNSVSFVPGAPAAVDGRNATEPRIAVGYLRASRLKQTTPVLVLDGTGSRALNRKVFGDHLVERRFPVPRDAEVVQVTGKTFSRQSLTGADWAGKPISAALVVEAENLRRRVLALLRALAGSVLLVTYKAVEGILQPDLPAHVRCTHFGAVRGLNSFEDCGTVVILGREQPAATRIESVARPFTATDAEPLIAFARYVAQCRARRLRDGSRHVETVFVHPDLRCQELLEQVREAEIVQAVDRVRPVFNRRRILLLTSLPLDITVDRVMTWGELQPSRFAQAFARHGVLPLSAGDLATAFPDLWASAKAAEHDLCRQRAKTPPTPQINSILWALGVVFPEPAPPTTQCTYRRLDQRGPLARALVRRDLADPRATLETLVGPLSFFALYHATRASASVAAGTRPPPQADIWRSPMRSDEMLEDAARPAGARPAVPADRSRQAAPESPPALQVTSPRPIVCLIDLKLARRVGNLPRLAAMAREQAKREQWRSCRTIHELRTRLRRLQIRPIRSSAEAGGGSRGYGILVVPGRPTRPDPALFQREGPARG